MSVSAIKLRLANLLLDYIAIAGERYGLGVSDPAQIELVRLGWMEEALI